MIGIASARRNLFWTGFCFFVLSLTFLFVSIHKAHQITGYLEQADGAFPYVQKGVLTSLLAVVLCCFGTAWKRIAAGISSGLLFLYWLALGVTLY